MNTQHIPEITSASFDQAQVFVRKSGIKQWRNTAYIESIKELIAKGVLPTDMAIASHIGGQRSKNSTHKAMDKFVKLGLIRTTDETDLGTAYELTERGVQANARIKEIHKEWRKLHVANIEAPAPDYSNAFQKLNHQIKQLNIEINRLEDLVTTKDKLIAYQDQWIGRLEVQAAHVIDIF